MADTIVVLDSSDDDEDLPRTRKKSPTDAHANSSSKRVSPQNSKKRKIQPTDDDASASKRILSTEDLTTTRSFSDQHLGGALLPLMSAVETLATPSATPPLQLLASPPRNTNIHVKKIDKSPLDVDCESPKSAEKTARRVTFTTVLRESDDAWQELRQKRLGSSTSLRKSPQPSTSSTSTPSEVVFADSSKTVVMDLTNSSPAKVDNEAKSESSTAKDAKEKRQPLEEKAPLEKEYEELIRECRKADPSPDMDKLIETKLLKYYYSVHPDFVKSRGFRKNVCSTIQRIRAEPGLVYYNLKTVVDELNVRRKSKDVVITNETNVGSASTMANKHTEEQIKKLNKALYILKKRIAKLDEAEVDFDDEDSVFLQAERFKKRACQIYEKICDLTGESKNARRLVKKPIQFSGTSYPSFNKTLQAYINRTKEFPDYFDVLRMLEHCNRQYDLKLASFEVKRIAQEAFIKVGKILQSRRKTDLYETVAHYTANTTDPATEDPMLLAKLKENEKTRTKISEVIEKYARVQDDPEAVAELQILTTDKKLAEENGELQSDKKENCSPSDDSDDNDDEEDDENLDVHVDKLTQDNTVDISDVDSDTEVNHEVEAEKADTIKTKGIEKDTNDEDNQTSPDHDVELTENNNIMRTKTNDSDLTTEETNGIAANIVISSATRSDIVEINTASSEKSKLIDVVTSEKVNQSNTVVSAKPLKTTTTLKTVTNLVKQRTIAEIVISDEE